MYDKPITLKELNEIIAKLESLKPDIHMNQKAYDSLANPDVLESLNIKINNHLPDNNVIIIPAKEKEVRFKFL